VTGGRNGFGAKLTNIFSKKFIVETADSSHGKKFKQTYTSNMKNKGEPQIEDFSKDSYSFTSITFEPDFKKFDIDSLSNDMLSLLYRRVYDIAGISPKTTSVYLNGKKITEIKDFSTYID
jgi:DNA topoisomerase-2